MDKKLPTVPSDAPQRGSELSRKLFKSAYLALGWRFQGDFPNYPKAVAIVSPHTSNYDAFYAFLVMLGIGIKVTIFGKDSLFDVPVLRRILKWVGVIPVKRDTPQGLTQQIVDVIHQHEKIWVAMAPEGTRKNAEKMRSGFYHIAWAAKIPVVVFAFDYDKKIIRCLGVKHLTGNYEQDLSEILSMYKGNFSPKIKSRLAKPLKDLL